MASQPNKPPSKKGKGGGKRPPNRLNKMSSAGRVAGGLVSNAMRMRGFAQAEIVTRWGQIVGEELAAYTIPVRLMFPRGERMGATLIVRCESAFAPLLQHKAPRVVEMVNMFFGYGAVTRLDVKQGPLPRRTLRTRLEKKKLVGEEKKRLNDIVAPSQNEELSPLKQALQSLGEYVYTNKKDANKN